MMSWDEATALAREADLPLGAGPCLAPFGAPDSLWTRPSATAIGGVSARLELPLEGHVFVARETAGDWSGEVAGIGICSDGRWVAWETTWDPTGDGFTCDAYGGDAAVVFGPDPFTLAAMALTQDGRALLGWPEPEAS